MRSFVFLLLILCGCGSDNELINTRNYILAGVTDDGVINYIDFTPPKKIEMKNKSVNGIPTTTFEGELKMDLGVRGRSELTFSTFYGYGCSLFDCFAPTEGCIIYSNNPAIQYSPTALGYNDRIDKNLTWIPLVAPQKYLSAYPEVLGVEAHNEWIEPERYLAVRVIYSTDTVYGWIGLQIEDYYKLTLRDFAVNKR